MASVEPPPGSRQVWVSTTPVTSTVGGATLSVTYVVDTPRSDPVGGDSGR